MRYCEHIKPDGTRCGAPAMNDQPYCYFHAVDPAIVDFKTKRSSAGGRAKKQPEAINGWNYRPIDTTEDLHIGLSELFNAGMLGRIPVSQLTALSQVSNALLKLLEPPKGDGTDPDCMRVIMLRFLEEQHPELIAEFTKHLEEIDVQ